MGVSGLLLAYIAILGSIIAGHFSGLISASLFYAVIGSVIAIGPPTINYIYVEKIKRPKIKFGEKIKYAVAPLGKDLDGNDDVRVITSAVYFRLEVKNIGRATAKNCMVNVEVDENGDHVARWKIPENPERYDLLPGETREIHLFRGAVLPQFFQVVYNKDTKEMLHQGEAQKVGLEIGSAKPLTAISWDTIHPVVKHPMKISPESKGQSSYGGWRGQKTNYDNCTITVQAIAEDYKSESEEDFEKLKLKQKSVEVCSGKDNWQGQWTCGEDDQPLFDEAEELVDRVASACQQALEENPRLQ